MTRFGRRDSRSILSRSKLSVLNENGDDHQLGIGLSNNSNKNEKEATNKRKIVNIRINTNANTNINTNINNNNTASGVCFREKRSNSFEFEYESPTDKKYFTKRKQSKSFSGKGREKDDRSLFTIDECETPETSTIETSYKLMNTRKNSHSLNGSNKKETQVPGVNKHIDKEEEEKKLEFENNNAIINMNERRSGVVESMSPIIASMKRARANTLSRLSVDTTPSQMPRFCDIRESHLADMIIRKSLDQEEKEEENRKNSGHTRKPSKKNNNIGRLRDVMKKQTILALISIISSLFILTGGALINRNITLLTPIDCIINSLCIGLMFRFNQDLVDILVNILCVSCNCFKWFKKNVTKCLSYNKCIVWAQSGGDYCCQLYSYCVRYIQFYICDRMCQWLENIDTDGDTYIDGTQIVHEPNDDGTVRIETPTAADADVDVDEKEEAKVNHGNFNVNRNREDDDDYNIDTPIELSSDHRVKQLVCESPSKSWKLMSLLGNENEDSINVFKQFKNDEIELGCNVDNYNISTGSLSRRRHGYSMTSTPENSVSLLDVCVDLTPLQYENRGIGMEDGANA